MIRKLITWCIALAALIALATLCVSVSVFAFTYSDIYAQADDVLAQHVALVLGASIYTNGSLSPVLKERADAAYELYSAHKVSKILVSGDNSSVGHNEVLPTGRYLVGKGIPQSDIFLDYAGFDTYSSMYRAKTIFGVDSMVVVSQRFHLPRALILAHAMGVQAVGLDASDPGERYLSNAMREIPATMKALFDLILLRQPQYLGERYGIDGDGSATWVGSSTNAILQ